MRRQWCLAAAAITCNTNKMVIIILATFHLEALHTNDIPSQGEPNQIYALFFCGDTKRKTQANHIIFGKYRRIFVCVCILNEFFCFSSSSLRSHIFFCFVASFSFKSTHISYNQCYFGSKCKLIQNKLLCLACLVHILYGKSMLILLFHR